jgi:hypothetical protein
LGYHPPVVRRCDRASSNRYEGKISPLPIDYKISTRLDVAVFRWTGVVTLDHYREALTAYVADRDYRPGRNELVDTSELEDFATNFNGMMAALRTANTHYNSHVTPARTVIWSPRDYIFGLSRMMQQIADVNPGISVEVFHDEKRALAKLDLPHESIAALEADLRDDA